MKKVPHFASPIPEPCEIRPPTVQNPFPGDNFLRWKRRIKGRIVRSAASETLLKYIGSCLVGCCAASSLRASESYA